MAANPFDLPTGGFAGEATITDPAFVLNEKFTDDDGNMLCLLSVTLDPADGEHEPFEKLYTCGPGWEPADGGARAVKADDPDNEKVNFNGGTKAGRLIKAIVALCPDVIRDRYADGDGVGSTDAAMFDGLRFNWADEVKPYQFKDRQTGETVKGESALLLPTEFVGVEGAAKPAKKSPAKPAKKSPAKKAEEEGFPADLFDQAWELYVACEGFDDWLEGVLGLAGVESHIDHVTAPDGGLWDELVAKAEAEG